MIDRKELVQRHNPKHNKVDIRAPLSVGNGEFAFTADITGMQSFAEEYNKGQPLCTQSQWGWHSHPRPSNLSYQKFTMVKYDTPHGKQGYPTSSRGQDDIYTYLRQNPHRLHLGQIGMELFLPSGKTAKLEDIKAIDQTLDLFSGILHSCFMIESSTVKVKTACHPERDRVAFQIESNLLQEERIKMYIDFPGASPSRNILGGRYTLPDRWSDYITAADWSQTKLHQTYYQDLDNNCMVLLRVLDNDKYFVRINWSGEANIKRVNDHRFAIIPKLGHRKFEISFEFRATPYRDPTPTIKQTFIESAKYWNKFWATGGAIQLAKSKDTRALELERRIILSQYLTAIHCAGSIPPQETGLMNNSWYGKYNLEMHWWHSYHFALWNRVSLLERSLWWYNANLYRAIQMAKDHGLAGARWVKTYGPEDWEAAMPSGIGPLLIWCQPHPISFAEICYRAKPEKRLEMLEKYKDLVLYTAEYMADFVVWDRANQRYILAPPIATAQEVHPPTTVLNPTFELSYWKYGLKIAQRWRERLGLGRDKKWDHVIGHLSKFPTHQGLYLAHENCQDTYTHYNYDHPSFLACLGVLPGDDVDREIMNNTLKKVIDSWNFKKKSWGWDYPVVAMTAARLGRADIAISVLLNDIEQNQFLVNGHNATRDDLPCYLPANGALLTAVALMAAGWRDEQTEPAPGFPKDGTWSVQYENILKY